jgi:acyl dehydratase
VPNVSENPRRSLCLNALGLSSLVVVETVLSLKDFVGREIAVTDWFVMTQDRIDRFAEATEDRQWIHVDRERAQRESPYGTTIAHGFLTLSLLSHLHEASHTV